MKQLAGRVAVITGAGSGIGRATAEALHGRGCHLALVDIEEKGIQEVAQRLEEPSRRVTRHIADVADPSAMQALADEVVGAHGGVHVVVNNAGVSVLKTFEEHSLEDLQWLVGVNFWGVVHGCHVFLPHLRQADEAHIVNVSSMFGFLGVAGQSSYCATKFAVRGFSEALWAELVDTHIGVTSIHPGGISTGIAGRVRARDEAARAALQSNFDRYGHAPEEVAHAIIHGIERNQLRAIVGAEAHFFEKLKRLLPVGTHKLFGRRMQAF